MVNIDGLRKAGDAPGHKIVVAVCVCVFVVVVVVVVCGAGNDHLFCPTGFVWGRK